MSSIPVLVDIVMITYNHGAFIKQAIESVLQQKTDFGIRLLIYNDASGDLTGNVIKEAISGSELDDVEVVFVDQPVNVGMMRNFNMALQNCTAKYIAICEGDDYWTDPFKLQKQVAFLEANPEFTICYHRVNELTAAGSLTKEQMNSSESEKTYTVEDLARRNMIHTPSVIFRNNLAKTIPEWFEQSPVGDYVLHMLNARLGKIKYMPDVMAVYRLHATSGWSSLREVEVRKRWLRVLELLMNEFGDMPKVSSILLTQFKENFLLLRDICLSSSELEQHVQLVDEYSHKDFFRNTWQQIYMEELKLIKQPPEGLKAAFRFLIAEGRNKIFKK